MTHNSVAIRKLDRRGFTIVECLVCVAIVGVLFSLTASGVQSARHQAWKGQCLHNMRQQGAALQNFASTHGHFPVITMGRLPTKPAEAVSFWVSWQMHLLPYVDQGELFRSIHRAEDGTGFHLDPPQSVKNAPLMHASIPVYLCPADELSPGGTNYRACAGTSMNFATFNGPTPFNSSRSGWVNGLAIRPSDVRDGLSATLFLSERIGGDRDASRFDAQADLALINHYTPSFPDEVVAMCESASLGMMSHYSSVGAWWMPGAYGLSWYNHIVPPNSRISDCDNEPVFDGGNVGSFAARSYHRGGVNVVFGDGSGRFVNDHVDLKIWRAVSTIHSSESVSLEGL